MQNITVAIATHKEYEIPMDDMYIPIHSGAELSELDLNYQKDNTGINISKKNPNYSELTALYWLWKNNNSNYKGLVHYRRHFSLRKKVFWFEEGKFKDVLDSERLSSLLKKNDIILPCKRKYYIETIYSHYLHTHYVNDLVTTKEVIEELHINYIDSYNKILKRKSAHMFNMFIMSEEKFDNYCEWLFSILFEVEKKLDISEYNNFHSRVFGRISEILLDVWLDKNNYSYYEIPIMFMEKQKKMEKITRFLKAKIKKEKY